MPMASSRAARPASGRRGQEGGRHQGKPAGGLHFWWPVTASREGAAHRLVAMIGDFAGIEEGGAKKA